eukprot:jgi/Galph1/183/GphlegSOOS_G5008.1
MFPLLAFIEVVFDVEYGPCVKESFPVFHKEGSTDETLGSDIREFIAFHSMPDSTSVSSQVTDTEDVLFAFRVPKKLLKNSSPFLNLLKNVSCCQEKCCFQRVDTVGHSLFRVVADEFARRGYVQKAVVAICLTNMSSCFVRQLLYIVAEKLLSESSRPTYEQLRKELEYLRQQWDRVVNSFDYRSGRTPGSESTNRFLFFEKVLNVTVDSVSCPCGKTIQLFISSVDVVPSLDLQHGKKTRDFPLCSLMRPNCNIPFFHEFDLYACFSNNLEHLWVLWELMVLGRSILVVSTTPAQACSAVGSLLSLCVPLLPVTADWQASSSALAKEDRAMVYGITSAYLCKQLDWIPNVLFIGHAVDRHTEMHPSSDLKTKYTRCFHRSKHFLKALRRSAHRLGASVILREYFREMTLCLLSVFECFFHPLQSDFLNDSVAEDVEVKGNIWKLLTMPPPQFQTLHKESFPQDKDIEKSSIMSLLSSKRAGLANKFLWDRKHLFYSSLNTCPLEEESSDSVEEEDDSETESRVESEVELDLGRLELAKTNIHHRPRSSSAVLTNSSPKNITQKLKYASRNRKRGKRRMIARRFIKEFMNGPVFKEWFPKQRNLSQQLYFQRYKHHVEHLLKQMDECICNKNKIQLPINWSKNLESHIDYVHEMEDVDLECRLVNMHSNLQLIAL